MGYGDTTGIFGSGICMPMLVEVKEHSLSLQYSAAGGLVRILVGM